MPQQMLHLNEKKKQKSRNQNSLDSFRLSSKRQHQ